jgi:hypothetical protein
MKERTEHGFLWLVGLLILGLISMLLPDPSWAGGPAPSYLTPESAQALLDLRAKVDASNVTASGAWRTAIGAMGSAGEGASTTVTFPGVVHSSGTTAGPQPLLGLVQDSVLRGQMTLTSSGAVQIFAGGGNAAIEIASDTKAVRFSSSVLEAYENRGFFGSAYGATGASGATFTLTVFDLTTPGQSQFISVDLFGCDDSGSGGERFTGNLLITNTGGTVTSSPTDVIMTSVSAIGTVADPILSAAAAGTVVTVSVYFPENYAQFSAMVNSGGFGTGAR